MTRVKVSQPISVLLAEHDRWARLDVANMLDDAGFAVDQASNGMAAVRLAATTLPPIVLIGEHLPEITPAHVLLTLRADPQTRHAAVVQLGGGQALLDADGRLEMPCQAVDLLATIVAALEERAAKRRPTPSRLTDESAPVQDARLTAGHRAPAARASLAVGVAPAA